MRDIFLKITDVEGESRDSSHESEIDILSWSWGMSQSGTTHMGGGGGAGKVSVQDISITKYVDKSTPTFIKYCCNGKHFDEAVLTLRKAGESTLEYYKLTMKEVIISSVSTGSADSEDRLTENVTLNFGEFQVEYVPQKDDGAGDAAVAVGWSIAKNIEV